MKKTKKILAVACAMALSAAIAVGGTLAYLTSTTDTVTNTFTVGKVTITLDEAPVDDNGDATDGDRVTANAYKLYPGKSYDKDPTVHVDSDSEACWLFVKVVNGLVKTVEGEEINIEAAQSDDYDTIAAQMADNGWTALAGEENVYWHAVVDPAAENPVLDVKVFENFEIAGAVDNTTLADFEDATIVVTAYAVQEEGFSSAAAAWEAAPSDWTTAS